MFTCLPCSKKTFLSDIGASYQSQVLYKLESENSTNVTTEFDPVHGEIYGSSNVDGSKCYQWVPNPIGVSTVALITEELVIDKKRTDYSISVAKIERKGKILKPIIEIEGNNKIIMKTNPEKAL